MRRALVSVAGAIALLVGLAAASAASGLTFMYSEDRDAPGYYSKPADLRYVGNGANAIRYIEWSDWGSERASGVGVSRTCVGAPACSRYLVWLTALKPKRSSASEFPRARYYTKLRLTLPQNQFTIKLPLPE